MRVALCVMAYLTGFRKYKPIPGTIALCCHTNGMGHVIQMLRILDVLNKANIRVQLVTLGDRSKIPQHFLDSLRAKVGNACEIVDLDHEVHYDDNNGASISNVKVVLEALWKIFGPEGWRTVRQCGGLLSRVKPQVCISLWDPHLPVLIDSTGSETKILQVATQAILYEEGRGGDFTLDMLYLLNGLRVGEMLPLVFAQQPGAMPIVVDVPPMLPSEPYLVAYSCMPQVLTQISEIRTHRVILFAKNVQKWRAFYADYPNIEVQAVGGAFKNALAKSSGLIASPSPGAVIQALGCAKPCYLFIPSGHLEQIANYNYYAKHFVGVASPAVEPIDQWADHALAPTSATLSSAQTQSQRVRDWLNEFDEAAERTLIRMLKQMVGGQQQGYVPPV
mmetsp:Transcript_15182/g.39224  ORF Transcript_15182/g.39224 Transcript_15182/m.39224 type:complete len:391 (-) Transcript_15182:560-1732(-)